MRVLPPLYDWAMRRRVFRLYGELKLLEAEIDGGSAGQDRDGLMARLDALESRANRIRVPQPFAASLYILRQHIAFVRQRLGRVEASGHSHPPDL